MARCQIGASHRAEDWELHAELGELKSTTTLSFVPYLRDWIILGLGELTLGHHQVEGEQALRGGEKGNALQVDQRAAPFVKGALKGKYLLAAYDSTKPRTESRLFREIDPDSLCPVYGDSSEQQYDAENQGKLYIKLARDRDYLMYGDYETDLDAAELSRYDRVFYGLKGRHRLGKLRATTFAAQTSQSVIRDDLRGDGSSGPYQLSSGNVVENSEKVRIEVRDRFRTEIVTSVEEQRRHADYSINYVDGTLTFKEPISHFDFEFDPVFIVVTYEVEEGDAEHWVYGGRLTTPVGDRANLGLTVVRESSVGAKPSASTSCGGGQGANCSLESRICRRAIGRPAARSTRSFCPSVGGSGPAIGSRSSCSGRKL